MWNSIEIHETIGTKSWENNFDDHCVSRWNFNFRRASLYTLRANRTCSRRLRSTAWHQNFSTAKFRNRQCVLKQLKFEGERVGIEKNGWFVVIGELPFPSARRYLASDSDKLKLHEFFAIFYFRWLMPFYWRSRSDLSA